MAHPERRTENDTRLTIPEVLEEMFEDYKSRVQPSEMSEDWENLPLPYLDLDGASQAIGLGRPMAEAAITEDIPFAIRLEEDGTPVWFLINHGHIVEVDIGGESIENMELTYTVLDEDWDRMEFVLGKLYEAQSLVPKDI